MVKKEGRFCGEAYVVLASPLFVDLALTKNKSYMGRRYIEIFRAKKIVRVFVREEVLFIVGV